MENTSHTTSFLLTGYKETGDLQYLYFLVILLVYMLTIAANTVIICVICVERSLHEPMYMFLCSLQVNGLYGSTALCPALLVNILSDRHEISRTACLIQIYSLHTYGMCEYMALAVMGYDRYVSICHPFHYSIIMSPSRVYKLIVMTWLFPLAVYTVNIVVTIRLPLCKRTIDKVYCDNYSVVRLACIDVTINNIMGSIFIVVYIFPLALLILYSYVQILRICLKSSAASRSKALNTCVPHLVTVINFFVSTLFELFQSRFDMEHVPLVIRILLSVYFLILPPLLNPIIYGLRSQKLKEKTKKLLCPKLILPVLE
ncbi:olfactory receptor 6N1-like [Amia ocellicauda]|uniref:olfactory receptor 6N1-like n=1 Tax=Amia ocellicauda TaxID=2972642 RepID=UPI003463D3C7